MPKPIKVTVFGKNYCSKLQACLEFNQNPSKVDHRMRVGMSLEEALIKKDRYSGAKKHRLYSHWNGMMSRCYSKSECSTRYKGRITVCDIWKNDFWSFVDDMNSTFVKGLSIDRKDNDGNYEPGNCRWATRSQQQRNKRVTVFVNAFGEKLSTMDWQDRFGVRSETICRRIKKGINPEDAVKMKRIHNIRNSHASI